MNSMHRSLLSREEMTSILQERLLNIPTIESLSYEELLRIYSTFAVPLEKRGSKPLKEACLPAEELMVPHNAKSSYVQDFHMQTVVFNGHINGHSEAYHQQTKYLKLSVNTVSNMAKKRHYSVTVNGGQETTPAKRKQITWP